MLLPALEQPVGRHRRRAGSPPPKAVLKAASGEVMVNRFWSRLNIDMPPERASAPSSSTGMGRLMPLARSPSAANWSTEMIRPM